MRRSPAGMESTRRRGQRPGPLLAAALALLPAGAPAQAIRPLTEDDVRRAIPVLRALAAGAEEARTDRRNVEKAHEQAQRSHEAARGGRVDPVRAFRDGGGDRLLPSGFRIHEACSRTLTATWGRTAVVATAGFSNDALARRIGGCGPDGKADPALDERSDEAARAARAHLEKHGLEEQGPRLVGERFAAIVTPANCFHASPGRGCSAVPSGPAVSFTEEAQLGSVSRALEKGQAAEQDREAGIARAVEAAGFTPQEFGDVRAAIGIAADDARNPARLDALAAIPGELGATAAVRRRNLAAYRNLEGEVAPLLEAISRPR